MLCEKCKINQATTHISTTVNGVHIEKNLCSACAAEENLSAFGGGLFSMLSTMFEESPQNNSVERCKLCGKSFADIVHSGRLGCAACYTTFSKQLSPSLKRIHGSMKHVGKYSKYKNTNQTKTDKLESLKLQLKEAIANEAYEKAAEIRDEIKGLEAK